MATRFFFRGGSPTVAGSPKAEPTTGDKSAVLPVGTDGGDFNAILRFLMLEDSTSANTSNSYATLAQTTQQSAMFARHSSSFLAAQTISANTWTVVFQADESNTAANAFLALSVYVYRPSTNAVVGFIYDSATTLGVEFSNTVQTVTFSGSAVTAQAGDFLVLEAWNVATQAMATSYNVSWFLSGTTNSLYLETPQNLRFLNYSQGYIID